MTRELPSKPIERLGVKSEQINFNISVHLPLMSPKTIGGETFIEFAYIDNPYLISFREFFLPLISNGQFNNEIKLKDNQGNEKFILKMTQQTDQEIQMILASLFFTGRNEQLESLFGKSGKYFAKSLQRQVPTHSGFIRKVEIPKDIVDQNTFEFATQYFNTFDSLALRQVIASILLKNLSPQLSTNLASFAQEGNQPITTKWIEFGFDKLQLGIDICQLLKYPDVPTPIQLFYKNLPSSISDLEISSNSNITILHENSNYKDCVIAYKMVTFNDLLDFLRDASTNSSSFIPTISAGQYKTFISFNPHVDCRLEIRMHDMPTMWRDIIIRANSSGNLIVNAPRSTTNIASFEGNINTTGKLKISGIVRGDVAVANGIEMLNGSRIDGELTTVGANMGANNSIQDHKIQTNSWTHNGVIIK